MVGYVSLGSNLGDRWRALAEGLAGMRAGGIEIEAVSSVWETEPVDVPSGGPFLNMAARIRTSLSPDGALEALLAIERGAGRARRGRNDPRALDLDLLVLEGVERNDPRLTLPHPRMWFRRFVLAPLAEIAGDLRDPRTGRTVAETLAALPDRPWVHRLGTLAPPEPAPVYSRRL